VVAVPIWRETHVALEKELAQGDAEALRVLLRKLG
jgi:hypothetical protein